MVCNMSSCERLSRLCSKMVQSRQKSSAVVCKGGRVIAGHTGIVFNVFVVVARGSIAALEPSHEVHTFLVHTLSQPILQEAKDAVLRNQVVSDVLPLILTTIH